MEVKKSVANNIVIAIVVLVLIAGGFFLFSNKPNETANQNVVSTSGDKQIIDLTAKGGYSPSVITAEANKETILRVSTNNTFDCSSAFTIPKLGINKMLPASGKTEFPIAAQAPGTEIDGTCSMGMYSFKIKFS
jgi:plastocyanin domain-containing protein